MNRSLLAGFAATFILSAAALPGLAAEDHTAAKPEEATIPFTNLRSSIHDWEADGRDGIWVQDVRRDWYYARLLGPCYNLDFATRVAFVTPSGQLDRFSSIIVEDEPDRCAFMSFTKSTPPPPKKERDAARKAARKAAKEAAAAKQAG